MHEAGTRLGSDEYTEWLAFRRFEPSQREYLRAILEAVSALLSSWQKRQFTAADFLPQLREPARVQSAAEGSAIMAALAARMKAKASQR